MQMSLTRIYFGHSTSRVVPIRPSTALLCFDMLLVAGGRNIPSTIDRPAMTQLLTQSRVA